MNTAKQKKITVYSASLLVHTNTIKSSVNSFDSLAKFFRTFRLKGKKRCVAKKSEPKRIEMHRSDNSVKRTEINQFQLEDRLLIKHEALKRI